MCGRQRPVLRLRHRWWFNREGRWFHGFDGRRLTGNAVDELQPALLFPVLDVCKQGGQVVVEPRRIRVPNPPNLIHDRVVQTEPSRSSSGVQMIGARYPLASQTRSINGRIMALARCRQFHVSRYGTAYVAGRPDVALDVWVTQTQEAGIAMLNSVAFANSTTRTSHVTGSSILLLLRNPDAQSSVWATRPPHFIPTSRN